MLAQAVLELLRLYGLRAEINHSAMRQVDYLEQQLAEATALGHTLEIERDRMVVIAHKRAERIAELERERDSHEARARLATEGRIARDEQRLAEASRVLKWERKQ